MSEREMRDRQRAQIMYCIDECASEIVKSVQTAPPNFVRALILAETGINYYVLLDRLDRQEVDKKAP